MPQTIRIGTRGSDLALWQARHVADLLREQYPEANVELKIFTTKGDKVLDKALPEIGGKGLFTEELEQALLAGEIDCAVHSLKDLPTENPQGLTIGAIPKRAAVNDVLISKHGLPLDKLPEGAKIGTSSLRRAAQLRHFRPDFEIIDLRGNVPTRINKALAVDSPYDGIILAQAGVERLGLLEKVTQIIPLEIMLPAPAQGIIAVQTRIGVDFKIGKYETYVPKVVERGFLSRLGGGCSVPVAAYAQFVDDEEMVVRFRARVLSVDGKRLIDLDKTMRIEEPHALSVLVNAVAQEALKQGAAEILAEVQK